MSSRITIKDIKEQLKELNEKLRDVKVQLQTSTDYVRLEYKTKNRKGVQTIRTGLTTREAYYYVTAMIDAIDFKRAEEKNTVQDN